MNGAEMQDEQFLFLHLLNVLRYMCPLHVLVTCVRYIWLVIDHNRIKCKPVRILS